jgi:hypothetical protein
MVDQVQVHAGQEGVMLGEPTSRICVLGTSACAAPHDTLRHGRGGGLRPGGGRVAAALTAEPRHWPGGWKATARVLMPPASTAINPVDCSVIVTDSWLPGDCVPDHNIEIVFSRAAASLIRIFNECS